MAERPASLVKAPPYRQTARPTPSWVGTRFWLPPDAAAGLLAPGGLVAPSYVVFALAWFVLLLAGVDVLVMLALLCGFVLMLLIACGAPTVIEFEREGISARWLFLRRRWYFADMAAAARYANSAGEAGVAVRMRWGEVHSFPTVIVARSGGASAALWSSRENALRLEAALHEAVAEVTGRPAQLTAGAAPAQGPPRLVDAVARVRARP